MNKILRLYFRVIFFGVITNIILIFFFLEALGHGHKENAIVYIYSILGYLIKSIIFSLALFILLKVNILENKLKRSLILWIPFLFFLLWFIIIKKFNIRSFFFSFGYKSSFPHFFIQLLSSLVITISSIFELHKISENPKIKQLKTFSQKTGMIEIIFYSMLTIIISYNSFIFIREQKNKSFCEKNSTFISDQWKENKDVRDCMLDNIINQEILIGKTRNQLISLLGKEYHISKSFFGLFKDRNKLYFSATPPQNDYYLSRSLYIELNDEIVTIVEKLEY